MNSKIRHVGRAFVAYKIGSGFMLFRRFVAHSPVTRGILKTMRQLLIRNFNFVRHTFVLFAFILWLYFYFVFTFVELACWPSYLDHRAVYSIVNMWIKKTKRKALAANERQTHNLYMTYPMCYQLSYGNSCLARSFDWYLCSRTIPSHMSVHEHLCRSWWRIKDFMNRRSP